MSSKETVVCSIGINWLIIVLFKPKFLSISSLISCVHCRLLFIISLSLIFHSVCILSYLYVKPSKHQHNFDRLNNLNTLTKQSLVSSIFVMLRCNVKYFRATSGTSPHILCISYYCQSCLHMINYTFIQEVIASSNDIVEYRI